MPKPQMPPIPSQEAIDEFLAEQTIAVICSLNEDGTIHASPIFYLYEDGLFYLGTQEGARKSRNLRRDPRVTLLIEQRHDPLKTVLVYGSAEVITGDDLRARRIRILERSQPPKEAATFAAWLEQEFGLVEIRVRPDHVVSVDYSESA